MLENPEAAPRTSQPAATKRFEDLYRDSVARALRTAYLLCGDHVEAEDMVAQAFTRVFAKWKDGSIENFFPYLRAAIVNQRMGGLRRLAIERSHARATLVESGAGTFEGGLVDREFLRVALRSLTARQRATIVLRYHEGLSEKETAAILGVRVGTVKAHASRGLARMRVELLKEGE